MNRGEELWADQNVFTHIVRHRSVNVTEGDGDNVSGAC
jgi:hypothetical protein